MCAIPLLHHFSLTHLGALILIVFRLQLVLLSAHAQTQCIKTDRILNRIRNSDNSHTLLLLFTSHCNKTNHCSLQFLAKPGLQERLLLLIITIYLQGILIQHQKIPTRYNILFGTMTLCWNWCEPLFLYPSFTKPFVLNTENVRRWNECFLFHKMQHNSIHQDIQPCFETGGKQLQHDYLSPAAILDLHPFEVQKFIFGTALWLTNH